MKSQEKATRLSGRWPQDQKETHSSLAVAAGFAGKAFAIGAERPFVAGLLTVALSGARRKRETESVSSSSGQ
uniref:hypothetical protein n=1 Tax=Pantoea sp. IMH TaxID=1267600 RepID=UPI000468F5DC|nr:hypothetical protein [Pantoea sp. IMH]